VTRYSDGFGQFQGTIYHLAEGTGRTTADLTKTPAGYITFRALLPHHSWLVFIKNKMEKYLCPAITTSAGLPRNVFHTGKTLNNFL
jgi:hypothetical protein